ncbi:hypothetical protein [Actinomadura livida]|uniref:Uncharacterized protein n=1 Tax=Actinomadura livida TaxID=79909 RepID=A0A7W7IFR4_9ACTN|nr:MULTISPECIES: hypothetical protein [Actinomadura]MBB4776144.1 hypothetical protein [Actinomadura catellatispora]GGU15176.1 hypothetical protein GCM10010208_45180 [Actinomadura livida]
MSAGVQSKSPSQSAVVARARAAWKVGRVLAGLNYIDPPVVLSAHLPPVHHRTETLLDSLAQAQTGVNDADPDRVASQRMLGEVLARAGSGGASGEPAAHRELRHRSADPQYGQFDGHGTPNSPGAAIIAENPRARSSCNYLPFSGTPEKDGPGRRHFTLCRL